MNFKAKLLATTNNVPVYKFILRRYGGSESSRAMLLSYLIDVDSFASKRLRDDTSFFECTVGFIQRVLP